MINKATTPILAQCRGWILFRSLFCFILLINEKKINSIKVPQFPVIVTCKAGDRFTSLLTSKVGEIGDTNAHLEVLQVQTRNSSRLIKYNNLERIGGNAFRSNPTSSLSYQWRWLFYNFACFNFLRKTRRWSALHGSLNKKENAQA